MRKKKSTGGSPVKFYVALQGDKKPEEYVRLGKHIEKMGFHRIYVYDDLMYRPSWPILNIIALHTRHIQLGPCLVNGFYCHPAVIAENAVFLDEVSRGRAVLGVGRGAFFDYLDIQHSEYTTRKGCEETLQLVKRFFTKSDIPFKGEFFSATEKAVLRWDPLPSDIPIVLGSWNEKMAYIAGKYCSELQVAESWELDYLEKLYSQMCQGVQATGGSDYPYFSIGGISCISTDETASFQKVKHTLALYLPYLKGIMANSGIDVNDKNIKKIDSYSKKGQLEQAVPYISDDMVNALSLSGTPGQVTEKLQYIINHANIRGILFSPPYGTMDSIEDNLRLIVDQVISKL